MQDLITEPATSDARRITITVSFAGVEREVAIFIPSSYVADTAMPLVFALHGGSGDASVMYAPDKRIVAHAERDGFIAIFPNGLPRSNKPHSQNYFWDDPINQSYMAFLMDEISTRYTIDPSRIYFIGFSGGAKLIYNLACDPQISARIAAIATVAGAIGGKPVEPAAAPWTIIDPSITGGVAMSAYLVQGRNDRHFPIEGGFDNKGEWILVGFATKVAIWRHFTSAHDETAYPGTLPANVSAQTWTNPNSGHNVVAVVDDGLAHHWPHWDVMGEIWRFFQAMPPRQSSQSSA
ncbi:MAG TPA: PHB depolymerase family esterase [Herpetosiphonaceae bacterium]